MSAQQAGRISFKKFLKLFPKSLREMQRNDPLRMAGATAFFTTFSLPFIVIIIVQIFGLFVSPRLLNSELVKKLSTLLGNASAVQIRETATSFRDLASNWYVTVLGFLFIVFVSTTLFSVIKDSLNSVWCVRVIQKPGFWFYFRTRIRAFAIIVLIGVLFLAGLITEAIEVFLGDLIYSIWDSGGRFFKSLLNELVSFIIVSIWFSLVFRFLADARPTWRASIFGAIVTGLLFSVGKAVLRLLLVQSNIGTLYGTSGSIVLILLFVFYSSLILYYGANFVRMFSEAADQRILPMAKAYRYEMLETRPDEKDASA